MILNDRVNAFVNLGLEIDAFLEQENDDFFRIVMNENGWFTKENILKSLQGIRKFLVREKLEKWLEKYNLSYKSYKRVGVIMAGNIPLVGFHDLLCVLVSGHKLMVKLSSQDGLLMRHLISKLSELEPKFSKQIEIVERLNDADAFIGTGSDNSARYFKYYFGQKPNIIRQNRTAVAVLSGNESNEELKQLGEDIFTYYGLGCRNVSKVLAPEGYDFTILMDALQGYEPVADHHKYRNNYDYNKSIYLVNKEPHYDTGFLLLRESSDLVSPISVLFYQTFGSEQELIGYLDNNRDKIQCIVGQGHLPFGQAQEPEVWDYADGVDTLEFLARIGQ